jgi:hypothetical protein
MWAMHGLEFQVSSPSQSISGAKIICGFYVDYFCGLVVRVPGYSFRGPGSIPGATRFPEK